LAQLAADQENSRAQSALGLMYLQGLGATQNYKAAFKLLKRADDQGYAPAQDNRSL